MTTPDPMYQLVSPERLAMLMERTGTGAPVSLRELARRAGIAKSSLHALLHGLQRAVPATEAHGIARVIGVDLLVLFAPIGRSVALGKPHPVTAVSA